MKVFYDLFLYREIGVDWKCKKERELYLNCQNQCTLKELFDYPGP